MIVLSGIQIAFKWARMVFKVGSRFSCGKSVSASPERKVNLESLKGSLCVFFRSHGGSKLERALGRLGAVVSAQMGVVCRRRPQTLLDLGRVVVVCCRRPQTLLDLVAACSLEGPA